jgi:aminoglycoside phosphotransferase (APT) family kinase protein
LTPYVKSFFPTAVVRELVEIGGGFSKRTFRVMLEGVDDPADREIIMRQDLSVGPYGTTVVVEYPMLQALTRANLPVAKPLGLHPHRSDLGRPFMFSRKLPGRTLGGNVTGFATRDQGRAAALAIAELLAKVHAVDVRAIKLPGSELPLTGHERLRAQIDRCLEIWSQYGAAHSLTVELGFRWIYDHLAPEMGAQILVHGDMSLANVLFDNGAVSALLDWEFSHIGDPAEDLAYARSVMETVIPWPEFFTAYQSFGGQPISDARLKFFEVFSQLRLAAMTRVVGIVWERAESDNVGLAAADAFIAPILESQLLRLIRTE